MPRHVLVMVVTVMAFFALLWLGVVVLDQEPGTTAAVSLLTMILLSLGVTFSTVSLRRERTDRES